MWHGPCSSRPLSPGERARVSNPARFSSPPAASPHHGRGAARRHIPELKRSSAILIAASSRVAGHAVGRVLAEQLEVALHVDVEGLADLGPGLVEHAR
jgi:hypothetical protein